MISILRTNIIYLLRTNLQLNNIHYHSHITVIPFSNISVKRQYFNKEKKGKKKLTSKVAEVVGTNCSGTGPTKSRELGSVPGPGRYRSILLTMQGYFGPTVRESPTSSWEDLHLGGTPENHLLINFF
jgi:hypothetical protein